MILPTLHKAVYKGSTDLSWLPCLAMTPVKDSNLIPSLSSAILWNIVQQLNKVPPNGNVPKSILLSKKYQKAWKHLKCYGLF